MTKKFLLLDGRDYLLFLSPGFLFMPVPPPRPPGGTMWGYTLRMCRGFPCRNNDANGRASAWPLCSELFIQLRVNSPTLPNSTSFCILFGNSKAWRYTDFRIVIFRLGLALAWLFSPNGCFYKTPQNGLFCLLCTDSPWLCFSFKIKVLTIDWLMMAVSLRKVITESIIETGLEIFICCFEW